MLRFNATRTSKERLLFTSIAAKPSYGSGAPRIHSLSWKWRNCDTRKMTSGTLTSRCHFLETYSPLPVSAAAMITWQPYLHISPYISSPYLPSTRTIATCDEIFPPEPQNCMVTSWAASPMVYTSFWIMLLQVYSVYSMAIKNGLPENNKTYRSRFDDYRDRFKHDFPVQK